MGSSQVESGITSSTPRNMSISLEHELASEVRQLCVNHGFQVPSAQYSPESFGNSIVVLESATLRIRLIRDRGQAGVDVAQPRKTAGGTPSKPLCRYSATLVTTTFYRGNGLACLVA